MKIFRIFGNTPGDFFQVKAVNVKGALIKRGMIDGITRKQMVEEMKGSEYLIKEVAYKRYLFGEFDILELAE